MPQNVSIGVRADTGAAQKDLKQFGGVLGTLAKLWENALGSRGQRQASANLQQLSRGMAEFGKSADRAEQRLRAINQTLETTVKTRMKLVDTQGKVARKDRDEYDGLLEKEKVLARQQKSWQSIAAIRRQMAQNVSGTAPRPGLERFGSPLQEFAGTVSRGLLPGLIGVGIGSALGGMVVHAIKESMGAQEELADFIPRMRPGALRGTDAIGLGARMRGIGQPFGFSQRESMAVFRAMSEGGSNFGHGLERDAQTAMQFGRMFGIDAGGEASMLAAAQRTGAFHAGDAKRFAGMLATEIARTGLGPRAEEVQQATMLLLQRQMIDQPRANAAPLMALQTILNRTGVPAFQGMAGAGLINQIQDAITNPNSEATEALEFAAARKAGARTLFQFKMMQAQGVNNPKFLSSMFQIVNREAHNPEEAQMALSQALNIPLPKMQALFQATHGFRDLTTEKIQATMKGLQGQPGFLGQGAAGAMTLPGNQIRKVEADFSNRLMAAGDKATPKLISLATAADDAATTLENLAAGGKRAMKSLDTFMHAHFGTKPGAISGPTGRLQDRLEKNMGPHGAPLLELHGKVFDPATGQPLPVGKGVMLGGMQSGPLNSLLGAIEEMTAAGLHPRISDAFRTFRMQEERFLAHRSGKSRYPAARPGRSAHERGTAVDIVVPAGERAAANRIMAGHGFAHNVPGDPVHYNYTIHIHDHTDAHHVKRVVKSAIQETHQQMTRSRPNTRNVR